MGAKINRVRKMATRLALECRARFVRDKRSELYKKVPLTSTAAENCDWRQELGSPRNTLVLWGVDAGKVLAFPKVGRLVRRV